MKVITGQGRAKFSPRVRNISKRPSYAVFWPGLSVVLLGLFAAITTFGQETVIALGQSRQPVTLDTLADLPQIAPAEVPRTGVFRSLAHPEWPPLPNNCGYPVWQVPDTDTYIVDDLTSLTASPMMMGLSSANSSFLPGIGVKGDGGTVAKRLPDISNYAKFAAQSFSVIDTNDAALNDPGLYQACQAFGDDTGTQPLLQIAQYQPGCLVLKASHFDYSAESRDFCLVVCDRVDTPLFKQIDLYTPANNVQNGGWLVQGSLPPSYYGEHEILYGKA